MTTSSREEAGPGLPDPGFVFDGPRAALVVIDPQNDFLSPDGAGWPVFGQSVTDNNVVANLARLFQAAESGGFLAHAVWLTDGAVTHIRGVS